MKTGRTVALAGVRIYDDDPLIYLLGYALNVGYVIIMRGKDLKERASAESLVKRQQDSIQLHYVLHGGNS